MLTLGSGEIRELSIEMRFRWVDNQTSLSQLTGRVARGENVDLHVHLVFDEVRSLLRDRLPGAVFALVDADRIPQLEVDSQDRTQDVQALLRAGKLHEALYRALSSPDPTVRRRLKELRTLLQDPLGRPPFDIVYDPQSGSIDLRESLPGPARALGAEDRDISVRFAGLGVARLYSILARLLLPGARVAGLEEPEANLHTPTTGRELRMLLQHLIDEGYLDQLFISTHSNLFDLDGTGYHEVTHDEVHGTQVARAPLHEVDKHFWEPGPAMRALREFLTAMGGDEDVGLRGPDGSVITTGEMLEHLQRDDDVAGSFLRDVHAAAVRMAMHAGRKRAAGE